MTEELFRLPGGKEAYLAFPDAGGGFPVLMALHGSGRMATSYHDVPFYIYQRDRALDNGFAFACLSNGLDTWGLDEGLRNVETLYALLTDRYPVRRSWVFWATSAGGALLHRLVADRGEWVTGALGTFPVYDLLDAYDHSPGCAKAWGVTSKEELAAKLAGRNPPDLLPLLMGHPYLIFHGREDTLLAPARHSLRFRDEANAHGGRVEVILTEGGHSTENFAVYDRGLIDARLRAWRELPP